MGRAFYLLHTVPVQGEERTLSLFSHSGKHEYGKVRLHLSIRGLRGNTPIEVSLKEHKMLMKALVNMESKEVRWTQVQGSQVGGWVIRCRVGGWVIRCRVGGWMGWMGDKV